jgi:hypothetical protein
MRHLLILALLAATALPARADWVSDILSRGGTAATVGDTNRVMIDQAGTTRLMPRSLLLQGYLTQTAGDARYSLLTHGHAGTYELLLACSEGQIKKWSAGAWICAADAGGDDLGSATAGDVSALFSGTGDYLRSDGTKGTPSGTGAVDSVFTRTGAVTATTGDYTADQITQTATREFVTPAQKTKLDGIAAGAEVNVNPDWAAVSGDAQILNKPTLGTAADNAEGDFATEAQGSLADTALQPAGDGSGLTGITAGQVGALPDTTTTVAALLQYGYTFSFRADSPACDSGHVDYATVNAWLAARDINDTNISCDSGFAATNTVVITGISGTGSVATISMTGQRNVTAGLSGIFGTGALASIGVSTGGSATAGLSGVSGTGVVASLSITGQRSDTAGILGVSGTGAVASIGVTIAADGTVALSGVSGTGALGTVAATSGGAPPDHTTTWETGNDGWTLVPGPDTPAIPWGRITGQQYAGSYSLALSGTDDGAEGYTSGYIEQTFANVTTGNITLYAKAFAGFTDLHIYRNGVSIGTLTSIGTTYTQKTIAITGGTSITIRIESNFAEADGTHIDEIVIPGGG